MRCSDGQYSSSVRFVYSSIDSLVTTIFSLFFDSLLVPLSSRLVSSLAHRSLSRSLHVFLDDLLVPHCLSSLAARVAVDFPLPIPAVSTMALFSVQSLSLQLHGGFGVVKRPPDVLSEFLAVLLWHGQDRRWSTYMLHLLLLGGVSRPMQSSNRREHQSRSLYHSLDVHTIKDD